MAQELPQVASSKSMTGPLEGIPLPDLESIPDYERGFWEAALDHELRIQQCSDCEVFRHLPVPMCPQCHSLDYRWTRVSGRGVVYSHVIVRQTGAQGTAGKGAGPLQRLPYSSWKSRRRSAS